MTDINPQMTDLNRAIADAHSAWQEEKRNLKDQLFALSTELELTKRALSEAIAARGQAERIATKFLTQFAVVAHVFSDAHKLALQLGQDVEGLATDSSEKARQLIDNEVARRVVEQTAAKITTDQILSQPEPPAPTAPPAAQS